MNAALRMVGEVLVRLCFLASAGCASDGLVTPMGDGSVKRLVFGAISDYGVNDKDERSVADLVRGWSPAFLVTLGDNNYASGLASTIDENIGKYFGDFIGGYKGDHGPGAVTNRFWPSVGNHDWYSLPTGSMQPYLDYFPALPNNGRYYDFVVGNVHFFSMDSDLHEPDGRTATSVQALWLRDRLQAATECFKVVYFHHPPYSSGEATYTVADMQWPFLAWGADVVLTGHQHQYERLVVDGMTYVVAGLGGAKNRFAFFATQPGSIVRYNAGFGALRAEVTADNLSFEFRDTTDRVVDAFAFAKACP